MRSSWILAAALLAFGVPAGALTLDPAQSTLTPAVGSAESLSGTLTLAIGSLPLTATTTLDLKSLSVTSSPSGGGPGAATGIGLDPASANPGAGVVDVAGDFLIPTLFLQVSPAVGNPFALPVPNVGGTLTFDSTGTRVERLDVAFQVDSGTPSGLLSIRVVALPEPGPALLALLAAAALGATRPRRRCVRINRSVWGIR